MKIVINNHTWTLEEVTHAEMRARSKGIINQTALGLCNYQNREIIVDSNLSRRITGQVVAHELGHAVIHEYKVPFRDGRQEEHYLERMDTVIYLVSRVFPNKYK